MELINVTPYAAAYAQGLAPSGHDVVVVVAKARCVLPPDGGICLCAEPAPPLDADTADGEHDFAPQ
jgi:hypothetical protein